MYSASSYGCTRGQPLELLHGEAEAGEQRPTLEMLPRRFRRLPWAVALVRRPLFARALLGMTARRRLSLSILEPSLNPFARAKRLR